MATELITDDGVIVEQIGGELVPQADMTMAQALARVEIDQQVATARQYPRSIKRAVDQIITLATLDEETATECIYALKRGGKPIRGPSIRLAEIIASQWGNCRDTATVVAIDRVNKLITAEGSFLDLETNRGTKASVQRRISDKYGKIYNEDMIAVTGNAACAIARRNAILAGVPKGVWRRALDGCEQVIRGDASTMVEKRDKAIKALAHFNLAPEQIFKIMQVGGIDDLSLDDIATLRVIYTSLKNGEQTVEELLRDVEPAKPAKITASTAKQDAPEIFDSAGLPAVDAPAAAPEPAKPTQAQEKPADGTGKPSVTAEKPKPTAKPAPTAASALAPRPGITIGGVRRG